MATPLAQNLSVSVQFREQYVSQALNAKMNAIPRGIVRGAILRPTANNNEFTIAVDPLTGDTVINAVGVAGLAYYSADQYAVTFRSTSNLTYTAVGITGALNFIYFVGGYTATNTTNAMIVSYTQDEFENGVPDAAGGVLLGVVVAYTSGVLTNALIMTAGMSNGVTGATKRIPFRRHNCENFVGGQGFRPIRERVASRMDFGYKAANRVPYYLYSAGPTYLTDFQNSGTDLEYGSSSTPFGNGFIRYQPAGADIGGTTVLFRGDAFDVGSNTSYQRKVRAEMVYRTYVGYSATTTTLGLTATLANGTTSDLTAPTFAPSTTYPRASTDWALMVMEYDVPVAVGVQNIVSLSPTFTLCLTGGSIEVASVSFIASEGVGVASQLDYGSSGGLAVPNSYGTVALAAPLHQSTALSSAVSVLQVKDASAAGSLQKSGWRIGSVPSQFYDPNAIPAGPNLYLVPEVNVATSRLIIGSEDTQDVETAALENRYASVQIQGNGLGTAATYKVELRGIPMRVDEIRPYAGNSGNAKRINIRDASGSNVTFPPPFISSAGTAGATGFLICSSGSWGWVGGSNTNFVNVDSAVTTSSAGRTVGVTFTTDFLDGYIVPVATYSGGSSAISRDYFVQAEANSAGLTVYVRSNGSTTHVPDDGDVIYFAVFGRLV